MGGNYTKSVYNQLMEVMERLDFMEAEHKKNQKKIKDLTSEVKSEVCFSAMELERYSQRYDQILAAGREENGKTKGRKAKKEEKMLLSGYTGQEDSPP